MNNVDFIKIKEQFEKADTNEKINIYISTEGLDSRQYRELLKLFPYHEIQKLEAALG